MSDVLCMDIMSPFVAYIDFDHSLTIYAVFFANSIINDVSCFVRC